MQEVAAGRSLIDPAAVESLVNVGERPAARLTAREREVLELIAAAESNSAIAQELGITVRAVERHVNSIFRKLGLVESDAVNRRVKAALVFASAEKR